jgi:predicted transport protein
MVKTSAELEREFIDTAKEKTGKSLEEWISLAESSDCSKRNELLEWLKANYGLNHMQSQFVAGIYLNNGKPVYAAENNLLAVHFAKSPSMFALFEETSSKIMSHFPGTKLIPKKTYLSFTESREFAAINVMQREIRIGLDLGDLPFDDIVQTSRLKGPMPRISHMIAVNEVKQINQRLIDLIAESFTRTHHK